jgi:hypothetical protein
MADIVRIWVATSHHAAFRCGGWAFVRQEAGGLSGAAGGERAVTPERIVLAGLAEALKGVTAGADVEIYSADPLVVALPARIAGFTAGEEPPTENLDLWGQLATGLKAARVLPTTNQPKSPAAFTAAWAELARDKAKGTGGFRSAIPKPNLAKAGV